MAFHSTLTKGGWSRLVSSCNSRLAGGKVTAKCWTLLRCTAVETAQSRLVSAIKNGEVSEVVGGPFWGFLREYSGFQDLLRCH